MFALPTNVKFWDGMHMCVHAGVGARKSKDSVQV